MEIGLTQAQAAHRLKTMGPNTFAREKKWKKTTLFLSQFTSPLVFLLIGAGLLSFFLGDHINTIIILVIVGLSGILGFIQEYGSVTALEKLLALVGNKVSVIREGKEEKIPMQQVVPGDLIVLRVGDIIPADAALIQSNCLLVNEATLTGESLPIEKKQNDPLFLGTTVISGMGTAIAEHTGKATKYGEMAESALFHPPETAFEIGVRSFGFFLLKMTIGITTSLFIMNLMLHKPLIESLLFSLAIAVGLTPQLLPAIITVNLSHGARRMAKKKVIVKRLASLENFGQMNLLCSDKTGTLTEGNITLIDTLGSRGASYEKVPFFAFLNAKFQEGYANPLDAALLEKLHYESTDFEKTGEIPYDFDRKRITLFFKTKGKTIAIVKGAFDIVMPLCQQIELEDGTIEPLAVEMRSSLNTFFKERGRQGNRVLGVAYGDNEENLIFLGFLLFSDPIRPNVREILHALKRKGVDVRILTGDQQEIASFVASAVGIEQGHITTGAALDLCSEEEKKRMIVEKKVFAEVHPKQKETIIKTFRSAGYVVGYLGDGVNDVIALHAADLGISVNNGAPAAKEASDIVLLKKNLSILKEGIEEGRKTFINTLKYVYMATSANFGNMISMAGASLLVPFLPLLPKQILLTNLCSDLPEMALATDHVDPESIEAPVKWDLKRIKKFMALFGALNSLTDYLTFFVLLYWFKADVSLFRTAWTIENIVTAALIVLVLRTKRFAFRSKPGKLLVFAIIAIIILAVCMPYTILGSLFDFQPIPFSFYAALLAIVFWFFLSNEIAKYFFFRIKH